MTSSAARGPEHDQATVDRVARAIRSAVTGTAAGRWDECSALGKDKWRAAARAALEGQLVTSSAARSPEPGDRVRLPLGIRDEDAVEGVVIAVEVVRQVTVAWDVPDRTYHVTYPTGLGHKVEDLQVISRAGDDRG